MRRFHWAHIHWSSEQVRRGLPTITRTVDPAQFVGVRPGAEDAWSLVCEFDVSPALQGTPSSARVRFYVDEAPHDRLGPGVTLYIFERGTRRYATVEILD
jgi:hypothetical protein